MYFQASRASRFIEMGRKKQSGTERSRSGNGANLGFEEKLWAAADKMRGHMDAGEYKHVALGLIFLKYISDAFQERYDAIKKEPNADPEDRDEYMAENVFWVPPEARWGKLQAAAKSPDIGKVIDNAMDAIEKENRTLKGVLPKDFARPALDKTRLGELIDLIGTIELVTRDDAGLFGPKNRRSQDILGRFAAAEGKAGGEAFTPESIVKLLVEMIEPYKGRVGDWCCGSGGMFVQSEKFVEAHGGRRDDLSVFGQESNPTTWRLCRMNLAIRSIEANLGPHHADSFHNDLHKDVKADFILANPPFNVTDWGGDRLRDDPRWKYGVPPVGNANFAWVQLLIHHLAPNGRGRFRTGQRLDVLEPVGRGRDSPSDRRGRPGRLHDCHAGPVILQHPDPGLPLVHRSEQGRWQVPRSSWANPVHRRPEAGSAHGQNPPRTL